MPYFFLPLLAQAPHPLILSHRCGGGCQRLAPALTQATGFVELRLSGNDFGRQAAHWLVPVLRTLSHLRIVDLSSCKLEVQDCMAVARALKDRDGVFVELCWNDITLGSAEGDELRNMSGIRVRL